jgi:hypothetical protein
MRRDFEHVDDVCERWQRRYRNTLILGLFILLANVVAARADSPFNRDKCIAAGGTKEFCSKERVKPHKMGWWCDPTTDPPTAVRAEGGFKNKRDALAYCN